MAPSVPEIVMTCHKDGCPRHAVPRQTLALLMWSIVVCSTFTLPEGALSQVQGWRRPNSQGYSS